MCYYDYLYKKKESSSSSSPSAFGYFESVCVLCPVTYGPITRPLFLYYYYFIIISFTHLSPCLCVYSV
jgi:hypothetical protein